MPPGDNATAIMARIGYFHGWLKAIVVKFDVDYDDANAPGDNARLRTHTLSHTNRRIVGSFFCLWFALSARFENFHTK